MARQIDLIVFVCAAGHHRRITLPDPVQYGSDSIRGVALSYFGRVCTLKARQWCGLPFVGYALIARLESVPFETVVSSHGLNLWRASRKECDASGADIEDYMQNLRSIRRSEEGEQI